MKKFNHAILAAALELALFVLIGSAPAYAVEKPAEREFNELVQSINKTLNDARTKAKEINSRQQAAPKVPSADQLESRAKHKQALADTIEAYRGDENPANEARLQEALVNMARVSTDFLEGQKDEIITGLDLVEMLSDKFGAVIMQLDQLEKVTDKLGMVNTPERRHAVEQAKEQMRSVLQMTNVLDRLGSRDPELARIKATMNMYVGKLRQNNAQSNELQAKLREQRKNLEHIFAQLQLAKFRLDLQKTLVAQLTLGQIVDNMLMKASYLLLGTTDIANLAEGVMESCDRRDDGLLEFQRQNEGTYESSTSVPGEGVLREDGTYANLDWLEQK